MDDKQTEGERINVSIGGTSPAAPVAPVTPEVPAAPAPPSPGSVVTSGDGTIGGPPTPAQVVTSNGKPGRGKRWLKGLFIIILLAALAAGGWFAYNQYVKKKPVAPAVTHSKDIPLLRVGILQADFGNLYPNISSNDYGFTTNMQMFEGLVRYENKSKIVPDLATNWTNPDNKTWIFTIAKGIKFHDGNTMTASDVKYSIDTVKASKSDFAQTNADTIASVDVINDNQVKITTTDPDPTLLNKLTFLYVIDANLPKGDEPSMAGTGPYQIKPGTKPTDKSVQMVAFNGYHYGRPTTKALSFGTEADTNSLVKAYKANTYDIVGYVPLSATKQAPNAKHFVTTASDVDFLGFNTVKPGPLQNKLVREAIRYAVDANAIGKARGSDIMPLSQLIPETIPGYNPSITPYKQDIDKAKKLLAQAGYPNGLTIRFSTSTDAGSTTEVTNELKKVGITLKQDKHTDFDEFISYFSSGKAELFTIDYSSDTLDGLDIYNTTLQSANYNNPKLTSLLKQASTETNPAKRLKLLQDAAVIIDQDVAIVPLSTENDLWFMNKDYAIKQDTPSGYLPVYFYKTHLN
jgi:ABC-type transport system substrate-binding protein